MGHRRLSCHAPFCRTSHSASCGTSGAIAAAAPRAGNHLCVSCADRQQQADSGHSSAGVELVGGAALPCSHDSAGSAAVLQAGDMHHGSEGCWQLSQVHFPALLSWMCLCLLSRGKTRLRQHHRLHRQRSRQLHLQSARPMSCVLRTLREDGGSTGGDAVDDGARRVLQRKAHLQRGGCMANEDRACWQV